VPEGQAEAGAREEGDADRGHQQRRDRPSRQRAEHQPVAEQGDGAGGHHRRATRQRQRPGRAMRGEPRIGTGRHRVARRCVREARDAEDERHGQRGKPDDQAVHDASDEELAEQEPRSSRRSGG
jgi:hypothetical protein